MISKSALLTTVPLGLAFAAGAVLPFQAASNAGVARAMGHPLWGALTSLTFSSIAIICGLMATRAPAPNLHAAFQGPWWIWIGGLMGAVYVGAAAAVTPKLGAGGFLACVVAGQMVAAVLVDHFGLMGLEPKPLTISRIAGVLLILGGVLLVQGSSFSKAATLANGAA